MLFDAILDYSKINNISTRFQINSVEQSQMTIKKQMAQRQDLLIRALTDRHVSETGHLLLNK